MPAKLPEGEGKRFAIGFRTSRDLKERIDRSAAKSGRSVAQEVEARVQHSLSIDEYEAAVGSTAMAAALDKETDDLIKTLHAAAGAAMLYTEGRWKDNIYARAAVRAAIISALSAYYMKHKLNIVWSDIDQARLSQSDNFGRLAGRMLSAAQSDPAMRSWISEMATIVREREDAEGDLIAGGARRDATIKDLIGEDA